MDVDEEKRKFRQTVAHNTTKIVLCKTLIRPVLSYGAEAWTLTKKKENLGKL